MAEQDAFDLVLGSQSSGRRSCLSKAGYEYTTLVADIDEKAVQVGGGENREQSDPKQLTVAIAKGKARALIPQLEEKQAKQQKPILLITSDQVVHYDGTIREKPESEAELRAYLKSYESSPACTVAGVVVTNIKTGKQVEGVDVARQHFKPIPEDVVAGLIEKGDVFYCCGGFLVDDPLILPYLGEREGDEDSIIGLSMKLTKSLISQALEQ